MKVNTLFLGASLLLVSVPTLASHCPTDVKAIDAALEAGTTLDEAQLAEVKKLRDEGAALHEQGKHADSVESLHKALEMLGKPHS